jgi:hypothetical protein
MGALRKKGDFFCMSFLTDFSLHIMTTMQVPRKVQLLAAPSPTMDQFPATGRSVHNNGNLGKTSNSPHSPFVLPDQ